MKKRLLSLALALILCLGLTAPALALGYGEEYAGYGSASGQLYTDVPTTHWANQSIQTCTQRSWFNGYPDGTFRPEALIRRDEAAKVFAQALGLTVEDDPTLTFTDTGDNWAKAYIEATKVLFPNAQNLQGTTSFRPEQTITREETIYALVVAWRYASKATNADLSLLNMFSDARSISAGVKPYMAVAVQEGLVSGLPDGTIAAQKGLTRAEFATLLARALNHGYGPDDTAAPKITLDRYDSSTTEEEVELTGKVSPMSRGVTLTLNSDDVPLSSGGSFSLSLNLDEGKNTFALKAANLYGVTTEKTITITRAPKNVSIRLLSSVPDETQEDTLSISGKANNYSDDCILTVDGRVTSVDSDGIFSAKLPLEEGENTFEVVVLRQNQAVASQTITVTRTVPQKEEPAKEDADDGPNIITSVTYHSHTQGEFVRYAAAHPHKAIYRCAECGDAYYVGSGVSDYTCAACYPGSREARIIDQYNLWVHSSPNGSASTRVGKIPAGSDCLVFPAKQSGNWYWVKYDTLEGYVIYDGVILK